jgi:hypothetical protein
MNFELLMNDGMEVMRRVVREVDEKRGGREGEENR